MNTIQCLGVFERKKNPSNQLSFGSLAALQTSNICARLDWRSLLIDVRMEGTGENGAGF
jgi:hypothetical protein